MSNLAKFVYKAKRDPQIPDQTAFKEDLNQSDRFENEKNRQNEVGSFPQSHPIKVCTLFKPILRRFRSYLREKFDKGRKMSLYQHWDEQAYFRNVQIFMNDL